MMPTKKTPAQLQREINETLAPSQRRGVGKKRQAGARKKQEPSKIAGFFDIAGERVEHGGRRFYEALTSLTNAQTYGTPAHVSAAKEALTEAAESYASALQSLAHVVVDFVAERTA